MKTKTSVISTVYNEEKNIVAFINSVVNQTKKPDEFIIVDGGSKDGTYAILQEYSKKYKWIKVYQKNGANIAQGRNYAFEKSNGEIIFTSDSSTRFEKEWIKKILEGFEKNVDVVFGRWKIEPKNLIERFLVSRTPDWKKVNPETFIPSNRQVAFRRGVWERVGGWPEHIRRADDNWFHLKAHKLGLKYKFVKEAEVIWLLDRNLRGMLKLAFQDSKTEGFAGIFMERKIYVTELSLLVLGIVGIFAGVLINWEIIAYMIIIGSATSIFLGGFLPSMRCRNPTLIFVGPFLFILLYFSHVFGLLTGIVQRTYRRRE